MATIELTGTKPQDIPELARICFEAFATFHDHHKFPRDIPNLDFAVHIITMMVNRPDFFGVVARVDGKIVGSNFLSCSDPIGGVGPITVDPAFDGRGVGRALMTGVLAHARSIGMEQVRLMQDSFNTKSLSLYASVGFNVREPVGLMVAKPAADPEPTVRRATSDDLGALDNLSRRFYKSSRKGELAAAIAGGLPVFLREMDGEATGYLIPGLIGHGVAEMEDDALALVGEAARNAPPEAALFFCPLSHADFYRSALQAGHRLRKIMNYMTVGPFERPEGIWMPSIGY